MGSICNLVSSNAYCMNTCAHIVACTTIRECSFNSAQHFDVDRETIDDLIAAIVFE